MLVNNIDILKINNATLTGRDIQACNIVNFDEWLESSFNPHLNKQKESYSAITVTLLIEGISEDDVLLKISNIIAICKNGNLKFNDLNSIYNVILEKHQEKLVSEQSYELTLNFKSTFKLGEEIDISINRVTSKIIDILGNTKTPCILEITPVIDMIDLKINGVSEDPLIIRNLKGNKTIIIDGIEGTVIQDGINKFADTDMWEFPFLVPGKNNITLSKDTCNITIKYNPRYI
ncbi:hypothetical protein KD33_16750 [Clostridium sp. NCR]|nr:hypothetical protein KD33_16750 [Clostridium sp. NCR]